MRLRKKRLLFAGVLLLLFLIFGISYLWRALPIISGYGAKNMASAVFVQHRQPADVLKEDLGAFPISLGTFTVNEKDASVTGSVWGFAKKKAIYRAGLGCTLVNDVPEITIRKQHLWRPAPPAQNRDTIPWPYGDKVSDTLPVEIDNALLQTALAHALQARTSDGPAYTRAVLVVYNGKLVGEQYAPGFNRHTVMLGWSMAKSLTAALIGILVKKGKLVVDAPAPVPEWKGTDREKITLKQLLQQTSGLRFEEAYSKPSEVTNMLFKRGDMAAFTAAQPLQHAPGTHFSYSSGNSNILSRIIRHTIGEESYAAFPYTALFYKTGMYSALLEPDASGTYIGSSYSFATPRDFARFGLLYLNNGLWNGEQILPENWVQQTVEPSSADKQKHYGYQFWLNGFSDTNPTERLYPDAPADMFYAAGFGGQNVYIIPSKKLVVVRMGLYDIDENRFLREVIAAVRP